MSYETFQCERHGTPVAILNPTQAAELGVTFGCPACTAELSGRDPATMTGDERAAELEDWLNRNLTVAFTDLHERIEALVGRPVWTHEIARPDHLIREARSGQHPPDLEAHVIGSLDQLAGNKPVLVVRADPHGYDGEAR